MCLYVFSWATRETSGLNVFWVVFFFLAFKLLYVFVYGLCLKT